MRAKATSTVTRCMNVTRYYFSPPPCSENQNNSGVLPQPWTTHLPPAAVGAISSLHAREAARSFLGWLVARDTVTQEAVAGERMSEGVARNPAGEAFLTLVTTLTANFEDALGSH